MHFIQNNDIQIAAEPLTAGAQQGINFFGGGNDNIVTFKMCRGRIQISDSDTDPDAKSGVFPGEVAVLFAGQSLERRDVKAFPGSGSAVR